MMADRTTDAFARQITVFVILEQTFLFLFFLFRQGQRRGQENIVGLEEIRIEIALAVIRSGLDKHADAGWRTAETAVTALGTVKADDVGMA